MGKRSGHVVQREFRDLVGELVREDVAGLAPPGARREALVAFLSGAFFELLVWSLEARPTPTAEEADALFQELAGPVLASARPTGPPGVTGPPGRGRGDGR